MTKLKLSSKMHIMVAVSAIIIAIGLAMGLIFQFVSDGYFNYGSDYASYNSVSVDFAFIDYTNINHNSEDGIESAVKEVCDDAFKTAGVSYYNYTSGETADGTEITFKFSKSADEAKIKSAVTAINGKLNPNGGEVSFSSASFHSTEAVLGGGKALAFGAIALASAVVFQFLYFVIRYKLTAAFAALLADVHNLAIFVSLLAITRVPVGSTVVAFGALTVLLTMIGCCYVFDKLRKVSKDDNLAKLGAFEQVDACANDSVVNTAFPALGIALIAVLLFVLMSVSAMAIETIITPVIMALLAALASEYGTAFFIPSVYSRFKRIGDDYKAKHSKKTAKNS